MIRRVINVSATLTQQGGIRERAIQAFLQALERSFGFEFVREVPEAPFNKFHLSDLFLVAEKLKEVGILTSLSSKTATLPDEPPFYLWTAGYGNERGAGSSILSEEAALTSALAECLERYLWRNARDYLLASEESTEKNLAQSHVALNRFAGFTNAQRDQNPFLHISDESVFLWARAESLISGKYTWIPAQTVIGLREHRAEHAHEPLIRPIVTTGLSTNTTRERTLLGGLLEVIERDAFMIMWTNQLTLPLVPLHELAQNSTDLSELLARCKKYRLTIDVARLITDAPAYAVCAVVTDSSQEGPSITVGLAARTRYADACVHAISEALRTRINIRNFWRKKFDAGSIVPQNITHVERAVYWLFENRAQRLSFLSAGSTESLKKSEWEDDTPREHLDRILKWCKEKEYECVTVNLGRSGKNPTSWHVYSTTIPELQPMHISERYQCIGGARLTDIPRQFGYSPRAEPFTAEPHPFT